MLPALATRILRTTDKRCLWKFAWNFGVKGTLSVEKFKRRIKRGEYFPPFLYLSIINSCNLRCQGCWVDVQERDAIDLNTLNRTIADAKAHGNAFFGILGGEPFMHPELLDLLAAHPDYYFQLFTNGQFITGKIANRLRELANATPLISIEGREITSDQRLPVEHRRTPDRAVAARTDRPGRALRLVSHVPPGRAEDERATRAAARPACARPQIRGRNAREDAHCAH